MGLLKNFFAFIIGIVMIFLFYYLISIPVIPCISIYAIALLFSNSNIKSRIIFIIIGTIIGAYCYGMNAFLSIKYYPEYLNILGIIFELITALSFIGAAIIIISAFKNEKIESTKIYMKNK